VVAGTAVEVVAGIVVEEIVAGTVVVAVGTVVEEVAGIGLAGRTGQQIVGIAVVELVAVVVAVVEVVVGTVVGHRNLRWNPIFVPSCLLEQMKSPILFASLELGWYEQGYQHPQHQRHQQQQGQQQHFQY